MGSQFLRSAAGDIIEELTEYLSEALWIGDIADVPGVKQGDVARVGY